MTVLAAELELLAGGEDSALELAGDTELIAIDDTAAEDANADETGMLELLTGLELPPPPPQAVSPSASREKHKTR